MRYSVSGNAPAVGSSPEPQAVFWNPHGSKSVYVYLITIEKTAGASPAYSLIRVSTTGTAGSTVTPDADNALGHGPTPVSGCTLRLADFTVNPTEQGPPLRRVWPGNVAGGSAVFDYTRRPLEVPAGTGLMVKQEAGTPQACAFMFEWEE